MVPLAQMHFQRELVFASHETLGNPCQIAGCRIEAAQSIIAQRFEQSRGERLGGNLSRSARGVDRKVGAEEEDALASFDAVEKLVPIREGHKKRIMRQARSPWALSHSFAKRHHLNSRVAHF